MRKLALLILKLLGWTLVGEPPKAPKYVLIFAPHTSNWDFFLMMLVRSALNIKPNFIGKHTLFVWPPVSWFMRSIGGEPVDRTKASNIVEQVVNNFKTRPDYKFALSPEGTRSKKDHWKSGFYRIAVNAGVPIQLIYLHRPTKECGFGPLFQPTGDIDKDFEYLRNFYQDKKGFRPELLSDIRVRDEDNIKA
ncbi:MAG: lysophospholipid acyltransferase family protein [Kangiellaceae bacterium]|nr:lysophospholipid acyltransferase family protein [Kangiellaceae bacterium]